MVAIVVLARALGGLEGLNDFLAEMSKPTRPETALAAAAEAATRLNKASLALICLHDGPASPLVLKGAWPREAAGALPYLRRPAPPGEGQGRGDPRHTARPAQPAADGGEVPGDSRRAWPAGTARQCASPGMPQPGRSSWPITSWPRDLNGANRSRSPWTLPPGPGAD